MTTTTEGAEMTTIEYRGHEIETDDDGDITVWNGRDGDHWMEPTVVAAKASIDLYHPVVFFGIAEAVA